MIGASLEALGDGSIELGIDGSADVRLGFVDDTICIVSDGGVCLFLAGEGPFGGTPASNGWHIDCNWSMVAWIWPNYPWFAGAHEIVLFSTFNHATKTVVVGLVGGNGLQLVAQMLVAVGRSPRLGTSPSD